MGRYHEIVISVINIDYFRYLSSCAAVAINFSFEFDSTHYDTSKNVSYLKANGKLLSRCDLLNMVNLW